MENTPQAIACGAFLFFDKTVVLSPARATENIIRLRVDFPSTLCYYTEVGSLHFTGAIQ
jgi:hypothetical protein